MTDGEVDEILRGAKVPERPAQYWERFPTTVLKRILSGKGKTTESPQKDDPPGGNHHREKRLEHLSSLVLVIAALTVILLFLHLGTALRLGDDEGYEVIKGLMCSKGYHLYTELWNDQPPVSTFLLAAAFKTFGASILTARMIAAGFGLLLFTSFYELIRVRSGNRTALLGAFLLVASPGALVVMVSVMLECPAFATALLSSWLAYQWEKRQNLIWLALSGAVLAVALQIKLTAALVAPALGVELFLIARARHQNAAQMLRSGLVWGAALLAVFVLIAFTWGRGSLGSSWRSHTKAMAVPGLDMPADHKFDFRLLKNHVECAGGTALCILLAARKKRLRELAFPVVLLCTAAFVHAFHRPWWNYYYLHFAIPLSWLAGWGLSALVESVYNVRTRNRLIRLKPVSNALVLCGLVAFALAKSERRLEGTIKFLRNKPAASANAIVQEMKRRASETSWVYSEDGIYAFHAGLKVIPELAIVMPKRFWSGQTSTEGMIETCKRYQPELVVLRSASFNERWKDYLDAQYKLSATDNTSWLYVHK